MSDAPAPPLLRVVRGHPTPGELAALIAVLATRAAAAAAPPVSAPATGWADRRSVLRRPLRVGPGGWRSADRNLGVRTRAGW